MRPISTTSSSMGNRGQMYQGSIVTELIFSNELMMKHQGFTPICGCIIAIHMYKNFLKKECRIIDMDGLDLLSWSLINKSNNLNVSMCVMGPVKIKFNKSF